MLYVVSDAGKLIYDAIIYQNLISYLPVCSKKKLGSLPKHFWFFFTDIKSEGKMHLPGFLNKNFFKSKSWSWTEVVKGDGERRERKSERDSERDVWWEGDFTREKETGHLTHLFLSFFKKIILVI